MESNPDRGPNCRMRPYLYLGTREGRDLGWNVGPLGPKPARPCQVDTVPAGSRDLAQYRLERRCAALRSEMLTRKPESSRLTTSCAFSGRRHGTCKHLSAVLRASCDPTPTGGCHNPRNLGVRAHGTGSDRRNAVAHEIHEFRGYVEVDTVVLLTDKGYGRPPEMGLQRRRIKNSRYLHAIRPNRFPYFVPCNSIARDHQPSSQVRQGSVALECFNYLAEVLRATDVTHRQNNRGAAVRLRTRSSLDWSRGGVVRECARSFRPEPPSRRFSAKESGSPRCGWPTGMRGVQLGEPRE